MKYAKETNKMRDVKWNKNTTLRHGEQYEARVGNGVTLRIKPIVRSDGSNSWMLYTRGYFLIDPVDLNTPLLTLAQEWAIDEIRAIVQDLYCDLGGTIA